MKYRLKKDNKRLKSVINLESSKSESNRALIINALAGGETTDLHNLSNARDTETMLRLLSEKQQVYDVLDAGTTMRFLTAYLAIHGEGSTITGTDRMKQRPIGPLVDSLRKIGADITYVEKEGYPPLKINQLKSQLTNKITIPGNISSQYISALLMIAPCLPQGLTITLTTEVFSRPYIQMTLDLMQNFGVSSSWEGHQIIIPHQSYTPTPFTIEGDWSGASYWYAYMALTAADSSLTLPDVRSNSSQGDRVIVDIMEKMGVSSQFEPGQVTLEKQDIHDTTIKLDFRDCPDLAQTVMVVATVLGITLQMTGLESLKIKETDRVYSMQQELAKIGGMLEENGNQWSLTPSHQLPDNVEISTYDDHRMAMAFAPLCQVMDVVITEPNVVNKSYPGFWEEVRSLGFEIEEV